jgi:hypothetical protein
MVFTPMVIAIYLEHFGVSRVRAAAGRSADRRTRT